MAAGPTYEPIATTTLGSAASSITFSSISSAYTDLRLVLVNTTSTASGVRFTFNSDTATNYSRVYLQGNGTTATSALISSASSINSPVASSTTIPTMMTVDIFSYAGSTYKTCLINYSNDFNGSGATISQVSLWRSTSAVTAINLFLGTGNFNTNTTATLYGIKAA